MKIEEPGLCTLILCAFPRIYSQFW